MRSSEIERDFKLVRTEGVMLGPSPLHLVYLCTAKSDALDARSCGRLCGSAQTERGAVATAAEKEEGKALTEVASLLKLPTTLTKAAPKPSFSP